MSSNLKKSDVQLLLKNKEIRNSLLDALKYFQKKNFDDDVLLGELIDNLNNEKIISSSKDFNVLLKRLQLQKMVLLEKYPDINRKYQILSAQRQKNNTKALNNPQDTSYSQRMLKTIVFSKTELKKRAGLEDNEIDITLPQTEIFDKSHNSSDDNFLFLKELEQLTNVKQRKKIQIDVKNYFSLLKILLDINPNIKEEDLPKIINKAENDKIIIKDPTLLDYYQKALKNLK